MDFADALRALYEGHKISRKGWNGKGQYVILAFMDSCTMADGRQLESPRHENIGDSFLMFVGTSGYQCGWLASQSDMLSTDWGIVG